jgi:DNA recombination-dependent growth factor C
MEKENKQVKLIDPVAIGALVFQACQSFELLERLDDRSVKLSPPFSKAEGINDLESTCQRALVMHFEKITGVIPAHAIRDKLIAKIRQVDREN